MWIDVGVVGEKVKISFCQSDPASGRTDEFGSMLVETSRIDTLLEQLTKAREQAARNHERAIAKAYADAQDELKKAENKVDTLRAKLSSLAPRLT